MHLQAAKLVDRIATHEGAGRTVELADEPRCFVQMVRRRLQRFFSALLTERVDAAELAAPALPDLIARLERVVQVESTLGLVFPQYRQQQTTMPLRLVTDERSVLLRRHLRRRPGFGGSLIQVAGDSLTVLQQLRSQPRR